MSLIVLRRKLHAFKNHTDLCQDLERVLQRLTENPMSSSGKLYADCLERKLNRKLCPNMKNPIGRRIENMVYPSIRASMLEYEKEHPQQYRVLKSGLAGVLFRPSVSPYGSLSLKDRHILAKDCAQQLAWLYVFHLRKLEGFIENSFALIVIQQAFRFAKHNCQTLCRKCNREKAAS